MPIKFRCEHCRQLLGISQSKAGEHVDCPTCGRSVLVPPLDGQTSSEPKPSWNPKDQALLNALESLASLSTESDSPSPIEQLASSDEEGGNAPLSPQPVAKPEPIELPPLEKPVALREPTQNSVMEPSDAEENEEDSSEPVPMAEGEVKIDELPTSENSPALPSADRVPAVSLDNPVTVTSPPQVPISSPAPSHQKGVSVTVLVVLALCAFGAGYWVRGLSPSHQEPISSSVTDLSTKPSNSKEKEATETGSAEDDSREAIEGRISYRTAEGNTQPDEGAIVVMLPVYRKSSGKLPITGLRPADSKEDRDIARAAIRALGGDLVVVDSNGQYTGHLPQAGEYHVLVLSRHGARDEEELIDSADVVILGDYFERPRQLLGQLKFRVGTVNYRGDNVEIWDHAFEAG